MISGQARWYTVGTALVESVRDGLTARVGRWGMVPGDIAWDQCDCDGMLAVTLNRLYLAEVFPQEAEAPVGVRCQAPYEVGEFIVSVVRCSPGPEGQDLAPPATDLDNTAGLLAQDIVNSLEAVSFTLCTMHDADDISDYLINPAEAAGPEGNCVGFTLRVRIALERS